MPQRNPVVRLDEIGRHPLERFKIEARKHHPSAHAIRGARQGRAHDDRRLAGDPADHEFADRERRRVGRRGLPKQVDVADCLARGDEVVTRDNSIGVDDTDRVELRMIGGDDLHGGLAGPGIAIVDLGHAAQDAQELAGLLKRIGLPFRAETRELDGARLRVGERELAVGEDAGNQEAHERGNRNENEDDQSRPQADSPQRADRLKSFRHGCNHRLRSFWRRPLSHRGANAG